MKFTRLKIRSFLGIREADIDLSSALLHIFLGQNNSAKSSVCDAPEYALTGLARGLLVKKDAASFLTRKGCDDMAVELFWEGGQLRRTPSGCSLAERDIEAIFGPASQVRASLSGFRFLAQPARDRRELVAGVTGKKADVGEALAKVCKAAGLPDDLAGKIVKMADEDIDHAETFAVEQRKAAKRSLEAHSAPGANYPSKVKVGEKEYDLTTVTVEAIEKRLNARKAERDSALRAEGEAALLDNPDILAGKIAALKAEAEKLPKPDLSGLKAAERKASEAVGAARTRVGKAEAETEAARKQAQAIDALGGIAKCPTCRQAIDQNFVAKLYDEAVEAGDKATEAVGEAKAALEAAEKAHKAAEAALFEHADGQAKAETVARAIANLEADLKESQAHAGLAAKVAELTAAVETGEKVLEAARLYSASQHRAKNEADLKHAVEVWGKIAKALGAEGDIRKMTASGFDLTVAKDAAQALAGKPLEVDENWNVTLGGIVAPGCSRSERLRLGAGFATAFAIASKLGLVVIDEADILQAANRKALTGWLLKHAGQVGTFMLGSTRDEKPAAGSGDPRVKFWWCEGGEVVGL